MSLCAICYTYLLGRQIIRIFNATIIPSAVRRARVHQLSVSSRLCLSSLFSLLLSSWLFMWSAKLHAIGSSIWKLPHSSSCPRSIFAVVLLLSYSSFASVVFDVNSLSVSLTFVLILSLCVQRMLSYNRFASAFSAYRMHIVMVSCVTYCLSMSRGIFYKFVAVALHLSVLRLFTRFSRIIGGKYTRDACSRAAFLLLLLLLHLPSSTTLILLLT